MENATHFHLGTTSGSLRQNAPARVGEINCRSSRGLYFVEPDGVVFGRIDPVSEKVEILFGDQSARATTYTTGTAISKTLSMGAPYFGGDGHLMTFDSNGLPPYYADEYRREHPRYEFYRRRDGRNPQLRIHRRRY